MFPWPYFIFAGVVVAVIFLCWGIVRYYSDKHESHWFPTWVTILGMAMTLLCVLLIPVDIYLVSGCRDMHGNLLVSQDDLNGLTTSLRIIYYVLYIGILAFAFILIPFAYFYFEESDDDTTIKARLYAGCKYTIFLVLFVVILLVVGMIVWKVNPSDNLPTSTSQAKTWVVNEMGGNVGEAALSFAVAALTTLGYVSWITYTAYGLSALPIFMIRGKRRVDDEFSEVVTDIEKHREKKKQIQKKYMGGKSISTRDQDRMDLLSARERALNRRADRLEQVETGWRRCLVCLRPFVVLLGIFFILVTLLIFVAILLTNFDKALHSHNFCGAPCGYVLAYPQILNPLDYILTAVSPYFPVDYVILGGIVIYIFFATLEGAVRAGIRFLWILMYRVRPKRTVAQGLLLTSTVLMFSTLALNMEITTMAPQYSNWGSQHYWDTTTNSTQPCSLNAPTDKCTMTQIGTFVNRIQVTTSFFGIIFFYATWIFLVTFLVGIIIAVCKSRSKNVEENDSDEDEDEN